MKKKQKMPYSVSKSQFKPKALEFFRMIQEENKSLVITHDGKPVLKISPYGVENEKEAEKKRIKNKLKGSVMFYEDPTEPVGLEDWELLK